jgi:hypothetical protein
MSFYPDDDHEEEREVQTLRLDELGPCCICGRPGRRYGCFRCGQPVCYNDLNYFASSECGGWILDSWHPGHPDENEFRCQICLHVIDGPIAIADGQILAEYAADKSLIISVNGGQLVGGQTWKLSLEETRDLVAYLSSERGDLFGRHYDPDKPEENAQEPVAVGGQDDLLDLDEHPF